MSSYKDISKEKVLEAIKGSYGITMKVAARLGCAWETARNLINRWKETKSAWEAENEIILDVAESQVYTSVASGDISTAKWLLARKGKSRGYVEIPEVNVNQEPLNINLSGIDRDAIKDADNVELGGLDEPAAETSSEN